MSGFFIFVLCVFLLISGYALYGRLAERIYGLDPKRKMPCVQHPDGVDFVPMPEWKLFLIQLLNIAGVGPVFGAILGCLYGPAALFWIVFGCIFGGAMHDFLAALMSADHDGENLPEIIGRYLGPVPRYLMRGVCVLLLLLVGVVFTQAPAGMLEARFGLLDLNGWCLLILAYYFLATVLPINAIIGRIYPFFGLLFIIMAVSVGCALVFSDYEVLPDCRFFVNMHPKGLSIWPLIFVTIACGAISGFHATQSPMMVRCMRHISQARRVFYGSMIAEGLIALIWATVGLSLREALTDEVLLKAPLAVNRACELLLGSWGAFFAVLGVVVLPITSGDTAMRCCRLMLADVLHVEQRSPWRRLLLAAPLFLLVGSVVFLNLKFDIIWRYFGWSNQLLSCFTLWAITVCLRRRARFYLIALLPAMFMTCMCCTYLLYAPDCGICLGQDVATGIGVALSFSCLAAFLLFCPSREKGAAEAEEKDSDVGEVSKAAEDAMPE